MIPSDKGGFVGSFKNSNTLLIMMGPENCSRLDTVARMPDNMKRGPRYFLKEDRIFLGCAGGQLQQTFEKFSYEYVGSSFSFKSERSSRSRCFQLPFLINSCVHKKNILEKKLEFSSKHGEQLSFRLISNSAFDYCFNFYISVVQEFINYE